MNKNIKPIVSSILDRDKYARENTNYLVQQTIMELLNCDAGTAFGQVIQGMNYKGISFEGIARAKRKWIEKNPDRVSKEHKEIMATEEENYIVEYGNHIPRTD